MLATKNTASLVYRGKHEKIGEFTIARALPNRQVRAVGPFVLVDHIPENFVPARTASKQNGSEAHPHKGFATVSYSIAGEFVHFDSLGNCAKTSAGGLQWMNAGNGVVHDGGLSEEFQSIGGKVNAFQFWVNIPPAEKRKKAQYLSLKRSEIPEIELAENAGHLRVLLGTHAGETSPVLTYTDQVLLHVVLKPGAKFEYTANSNREYAAYPAKGHFDINGESITTPDTVFFDVGTDRITVQNTGDESGDLMILGGEPYSDPIVFGGPFVMNSDTEIEEAYAEFRAGKFGTVKY